MSYTRKIRFEYFEVVFKKNSDASNTPDRAFDLSLWINKAAEFSFEGRTYDYYQEQARLDRFWYDDRNFLWFLSFLRLRETNLPNIAKRNQEAEPMELEDDEYIGENACAVYDKDHNILMLQKNIHSLGPRGIELYLNKVWGFDSGQIFLRPICPINIQAIAQQATEYRKFKIRFADVRKNEIDGEGMLKNIYDNIKRYRAINAELTLTMGYEKGESLDNATVRETINEVMANQGIVSKAEIGFKKEEDTLVEVMDLFEEKMHDFIFVNLERRESIASEYMADRMMERYLESRGSIIESLRVRNEE